MFWSCCKIVLQHLAEKSGNGRRRVARWIHRQHGQTANFIIGCLGRCFAAKNRPEGFPPGRVNYDSVPTWTLLVPLESQSPPPSPGIPFPEEVSQISSNANRSMSNCGSSYNFFIVIILLPIRFGWQTSLSPVSRSCLLLRLHSFDYKSPFHSLRHKRWRTSLCDYQSPAG